LKKRRVYLWIDDKRKKERKKEDEKRVERKDGLAQNNLVEYRSIMAQACKRLETQKYCMFGKSHSVIRVKR
jgi:hypothetical protein